MPEGKRLGRVVLTNTSRVMYPELNLTKRDVVEYYLRIAPRILPHLGNRALVLQRFPDGVSAPGFYEKDAPAGTPEWVHLYRHHSVSAGRDLHYIVCDSPDTLIWLANLAAIELNIPLARLDDPESPDLLLFDIDPEPPAGFREGVTVALALRDMLFDLGLFPFVKTSGKKGLHVVTSPADTGSAIRGILSMRWVRYSHGSRRWSYPSSPTPMIPERSLSIISRILHGRP